MKKAIVSIQGLFKTYKHSHEQALKGVDLDIHEGQFFGLLGPNGSGKTTIISILCGLLSASAGDATICGHKLSSEMSKIKPYIGLVPQEIALYPTLTLRQNMDFFAKLYGLPRLLRKRRIEKYLDIVQLADYADMQIRSYSGGMKRRANLATGLVHEPKILFLDEPTVNVDPQSRHVIYDSLDKLIQEKTTIVYTTHHLDEAENLCSDVAIIDYGKIIATGTPQQLVDSTANSKNLGEVFLHLTGHELRDNG